MAVVGADDDVVFAGIAEHEVEIVVGLGGDVNVEVFKRQFGKTFAAAAAQILVDVFAIVAARKKSTANDFSVDLTSPPSRRYFAAWIKLPRSPSTRSGRTEKDLKE